MVPVKLTDSDKDLYRQLVDALYVMPPRERQTAHWVMGQEWVRRIDAMRLAGIDPMPSWAWMPDKVLLGKHVKVTDDGGEPHMEAEPGLHHAHLSEAP